MHFGVNLTRKCTEVKWVDPSLNYEMPNIAPKFDACSLTYRVKLICAMYCA